MSLLKILFYFIFIIIIFFCEPEVYEMDWWSFKFPFRYVWESKADGAFAISEDVWNEPLGRGTEIRLHLREEAGEYLEEAKLKVCIFKSLIGKWILVVSRLILDALAYICCAGFLWYILLQCWKGDYHALIRIWKTLMHHLPYIDYLLLELTTFLDVGGLSSHEYGIALAILELI